MRKISTCLIFCVLAFPVFSQKKFTNAKRAEALKPLYKDEPVVVTTSSSLYEFKVKDGKVVVEQQDAIELITLYSSVPYRKHVFYNDNISLLDTEIDYASGKGSLDIEEVCGNYEIDDIFYSDAKVCSYHFNLLFEGSEVSVEVKKLYKDPKYLTKVFFHDNEPALTRKITFVIPHNIKVDLLEFNFEGFAIDRQESAGNGKRTVTYTLNEVASLKREDHSLGILHYYPHILVTTREFVTNGDTKKILSSVSDLYAWYHGLTKEVENVEEDLKAQVETLTATASTPEEKIRAIYYWVQDNIKYIAFEEGIAGFKPEAAQNVYTNRFGDCKGMAMLTREMLKLAGFDARLAWIGTNMIPYRHEIPSLATDNHMICTVFDQGLKYILDPTEKYNTLGRYAERIQGQEMLIENGDTFIRETVPLEQADKNLISRFEEIELAGLLLKGTGNLTVHGEAKKNYLYFSSHSTARDQDKLYNFLAVSNPGSGDQVEITGLPEPDRETPLQLNYEYLLNNKVSKFDSDLYISLDWDKTYGDLVMKDERVTDYYFGRKVLIKTTKKILLPAGYKITHLPEGMAQSHENFSIKVFFNASGNSITYTNEILIPDGLIRKQDFEEWNATVKKLAALYNDQVVISKN